MLTDLLETLDRQWEFLSAQQEGDFVAHLFSFVRFLNEEPRLASCVDDARREDQDSRGAYERAETEAVSRILVLKEQLCSAIPALCPRPGPVTGDAEYEGSANRLRDLGAKAIVSLLPGRPHGPNRQPDRMVELSRHLTALATSKGIEVADEILEGIQAVDITFQHARRVRSLFAGTNGGAAFERIEKILNTLHAAPASLASFDLALAWHVRLTQGGGMRDLYDKVFAGMRSHQTGHANVGELQELRRDAQLVYEDTRRRLGAVRSLRSLIAAFKDRCEWYEAARLRELAARYSKKGEDLLTEELARFLFDQGLRPLTQSMMARLRPDLVNTGSWRLYVESKLSKSPTYVRHGACQVWNTLGRIQHRLSVREVFYVVFRLDGRDYVLPERVKVGDVTMYPVLIDIASSRVSGSRQEKAPVIISANELAPQPASSRRR